MVHYHVLRISAELKAILPCDYSITPYAGLATLVDDTANFLSKDCIARHRRWRVRSSTILRREGKQFWPFASRAIGPFLDCCDSHEIRGILELHDEVAMFVCDGTKYQREPGGWFWMRHPSPRPSIVQGWLDEMLDRLLGLESTGGVLSDSGR